MWVLILVICGTSCTMTTQAGYYTEKTVCAEAVAAFSDGDANYNPYRRSAFCIPAPDNLGFE